MIKGETVILLKDVQTGVDPFGAPVVSTTEIPVDNVLVGSPSADDVISDMQLFGKSLLFVLGIPKDDTNDWTDSNVIIRGKKYKTYGFPLTQLDYNVPGPWNTQVKVERYG